MTNKPKEKTLDDIRNLSEEEAKALLQNMHTNICADLLKPDYPADLIEQEINDLRKEGYNVESIVQEKRESVRLLLIYQIRMMQSEKIMRKLK